MGDAGFYRARSVLNLKVKPMLVAVACFVGELPVVAATLQSFLTWLFFVPERLRVFAPSVPEWCPELSSHV